ncbi:MAG: hypothetical protein ACK4XK_10400, partial [Casimicrobiaceae bacterium]
MLGRLQKRFSILLSLPALLLGVLASSGASAGAVTGATFSISSPSGAANCASAHNLNSVTFGGKTYTDLRPPDDHDEGTLPLAATTINRVYTTVNFCNYTSVTTDRFTDGAAAFKTAALAAFGDVNLNHYQGLDGFNFEAGDSGNTLYYRLIYTPPIVVDGYNYIVLTERGGNNGMRIRAEDCSNNLIGTPITQNQNAYTYNLGVTSGTQTIHASIFPLTDLVSLGTQICALRVTFQGGGNGGDGPDGKVFVLSTKKPVVTKGFSPANIAVGGTSTLTITIQNQDTLNGFNQTSPPFTDSLPSGLVIATPSGATTTCSGSSFSLTAPDGGTAISFSGLQLAANSSCTISVNVTSSTVGAYTNTVAAGDLKTDNGASQAPATATLTVTSAADLSITKTDGVASVAAGGTVTYTIVVSNAGPSAADGAVFTDTAVANLTVTGVSCGPASGGAACPAPASVTVANMQGPGIAIPTLPSGGSVTFTVSGTAGASGTINNVASVAPPSGVTDPVTSNNSATDATTIDPPADMAASFGTLPSVVSPGQSFTG